MADRHIGDARYSEDGWWNKANAQAPVGQDRSLYTTTAPPETLKAGEQIGGSPMFGKRTLIPFVAVVVLLLSLVSCSSDGDDENGAALSGEVKEVVDAYGDSWNNYDGDAFLAVATDDYIFTSEFETVGVDEQAVRIENELEVVSWSTERLGEGIMVGEGPWFVALPDRISDDLMAPIDGISTLVIVDDGGTLKVAEHTFIADI